jgi:hypothetical protein
MSLEMAHKVILPPKKNYIPQFLKQRDINSYFIFLYKIVKRVSNYILYIFYCAQVSSASENSLFLQKFAT